MKNQRGYGVTTPDETRKLAVYGDQKAIEFFADLQGLRHARAGLRQGHGDPQTDQQLAYVGVFSYAGMAHEEAARKHAPVRDA